MSKKTIVSALSLLIALAIAAGAGIAATMPPKDSPPAAETSDLLIYSPSGRKLIGHGSYTLERSGGVVTISGDNQYLSGESDSEHETLKMLDPGPQLKLITYEHSFFDRKGAPILVARLNIPQGLASCVRYPHGNAEINTVSVEFPPDMRIGASVALSITTQLKRKPVDEMNMHVFECAPGPKILHLRVDLKSSKWAAYPGDLMMADLTPVFGWYDIFLKPFVPVTRLWFDPVRDFNFVGGKVQRYYRGPEVMMIAGQISTAAHPPEKSEPLPKSADALRSAPRITGK